MHRTRSLHPAGHPTALALSVALLLPVLITTPCSGADDGTGTPLAPSAAPSPPPPSYSEAVSVSSVLVPVVVHGRDGYARGLDRRHFRLWVDGRRVPIDGIDLGSDAPLSAVWLQDVSGSMAHGGKLRTSRRAFETFLAGARPGDEIALATFAGGTTRVEVPFTDSLATLREAADIWKGYGITALHDAVSLLPELSAEGSRGKRVAILVTDGQDNASRIGSPQAVELVREARLPVYVLGLRASGAPAPPEPDGSADAIPYAELLRRLGHESGGRYTDVASSSPEPSSRRQDARRIDRVVEAILDDLRLRYILSVATAGDGPKSYHRLRVEAFLPGRRSHEGRRPSLRYRRGYFGTEPLAFREGARSER